MTPQQLRVVFLLLALVLGGLVAICLGLAAALAARSAGASTLQTLRIAGATFVGSLTLILSALGAAHSWLH